MKNYLKENGKISYVTAFVIIFAAVFLLFRKLFMGEVIATNDASTNDLLFFMFPIRTLYSEALKNGELLQWTPYIYGGFPLLAEGQAGFLYPVNLILCYLLNPFQAMNVFFIFHALTMGLGVYLFTTRITGSSWSSIPAGAAAAICGSLIAGHTRHMNSFAVISLTPWLFLTAEIYLRKFRISSVLLFGCVLGLMILIGHPQYSFVGGFLAGIYVLMRIYFMNKDTALRLPVKENETKTSFLSKKLFLFAILSVIVSIAISYAQIRDTMQLASLSQRGEGVTAEFTGMGSLPWNGFLTFIYPYHWGNAGNNTYELQTVYMFWEVFHYCSIVVFILALIGVYYKWRNNQYVKILFILALVSYLFALGNNLPLYRIFSFLPFVKSFRFPVRWLLGTEISLLTLSGFGVLATVEKFKFKNGINKKRKKGQQVKENPSGLVGFIRRNPYALALILSVLAIIDIYAVGGKQVETADPRIWFDSSASVMRFDTTNQFRRMFALGNIEFFLGAYQRSKGWEGDKSLYSLGTKLLPPNVPAYYHIRGIAGYAQLVPTYIVEVWGDALNGGAIVKTAFLKDKQNLSIKPPFTKISRMWGVKDFMSAFTLPEPLELKWDSAGIKRYELPEILPHAWVVKEAVSVPDDNPKLVSDMMMDSKFIPTDKALVSGTAPKLPANSENGNAEVIQEKNNYIKIRASTPGLVILSDTWYPRWRAKVDGVDAEIYRVNNMMRAVVSSRAGAEIEMFYDDGNVKLFLFVSLIVIVGTFAYTFVNLKNKNRKL
jgi:hypothetical protein